jgi:hypothetical protein
MIRQRNVTIKTALATLTLAEMGDILCNSAGGFTITLPAVSSGLWYRISNINTGAIIVSDGGTIATLAQYEQCLVLNNGTTWYAFEIHDIHNDLTGLQGGQASEYYHLKSADYTDLTDAGDSALHYHATDRARANHTGTQLAATISDFAHALLSASHSDTLADSVLAGDMLIGNATPKWARLAKGTALYALCINSAGTLPE